MNTTVNWNFTGKSKKDYRWGSYQINDACSYFKAQYVIWEYNQKFCICYSDSFHLRDKYCTCIRYTENKKLLNHSKFSTRIKGIPNKRSKILISVPEEFCSSLTTQVRNRGKYWNNIREEQTFWVFQSIVCVSVLGQHHRLLSGFSSESAYASAIYSTLVAALEQAMDLPADCTWQPEWITWAKGESWWCCAVIGNAKSWDAPEKMRGLEKIIGSVQKSSPAHEAMQ